jgi:hypothetical protein
VYPRWSIIYVGCCAQLSISCFDSHFTKKLGLGTSKMEKALFVGWNKMHVANDDMDVIFRFLSFF